MKKPKVSRSCQAGTTVSLLVKPRSSVNRVVGMKDNTLVVQVTAPPVEGEANRAVIATLAQALGVAKNRIEIISGGKSKRKAVRIREVTPQMIAARLPQTPLPLKRRVDAK